MEIIRKKTKQIKVGNVKIGGDAPVVVQSMTNTFTADVEKTLAQISALEKAGCEIIRVAVPDEESARAIKKIKKGISIPLIADIHFDWRLAIESAKFGADGLRINPGNIGGEKKVFEVVKALKDYGLALRIGVNSGSVEKSLLKKYGSPTADAMVESALAHIDMVRSMDFHEIKLSIKASSPMKTIEAYKRLSEKTDLPLHVGITEAGFGMSGAAKSAAGIGIILFLGIGDTIRVSLTGDPLPEIRTAYEILRSLGLRKRGVEIISCPTCGRTLVDLPKLAREVQSRLSEITCPMTVAVMGCVVNGPGEAKEADLGIAGGKGQGILFKKGKLIGKFKEDELIDALMTEALEMAKDNKSR